MPIVRQHIPALHGGVSQQAAAQRNPTQVEEAINVSFSVAEGASKRPPLEVVSQLTSDMGGSLATLWYETSAGDDIVITLTGDGTYRAFKVSTGEQITMLDSGNTYSYLTCTGKPSDAFRFYTVDNTLYVVNREITVAMNGDTTAGTVTGVAQTLQDTDLDGQTGIWKINGTMENPFDTYYAKNMSGKWVEWVSPGIEDTLNPQTMPHRFDILEDETDPVGYTTGVLPGEWAKRLVGDDKSNKAPSFVGSKIEAITVASDRMVLLSGQSASMSRVRDYGDFWRSTVTTLLDDDRIDVTLSNAGTSACVWMESVSGQFVISTMDNQQILDGQPALTPRTVTARSVTEYPVGRGTPPAVVGPNVYFASEAGEHTHIREMFLQEDSVTLSASNASSHAFKYVPGNVRDMVGHSNFDQLLILSDEEPNTLYSYQFHWAGDEKVLSAWGKWTFPADINILGLRIVNEYVYLIYQNPGFSAGTFMGRINLKAGDSDPGFNHKVHLDQVENVQRSYNETEDRTYFSLTFPLGDIDFTPAVMVKGEGWDDHGVQVPLSDIVGLSWMNNSQFYIPGDWTTHDIYTGFPYTKRLDLSEQFFRDGNTSMLTARCQIRDMQVYYTGTGFFRVQVKARGHDPFLMSVYPGLKQTYTSRTLGDEYLTLNRPQMDSGVYPFQVLGKSSDVSISLLNDSYLPSHFQAAEWRGLVSRRMKR